MRTSLITGANRGLGLEFVRQLKEKGYYVIGCCRQPTAAAQLRYLADEVIPLDVSNDSHIRDLVKSLDNKPIDLLVNNAGILGEHGVTVGNINRNNFFNVFDVNCISVLRLSDALLPNLLASQDKNILVVSSIMGSISENARGRSIAYRASKAALNSGMRSFAIDVKPQGVHVMLMHPGVVKTDMGGESAPVEVQTSVTGMLTQAELHFHKSHAEILRQYDGQIIPW